MEIPSQLSADEFNSLVKKGVIDTSGKRFKTNQLLPEYERTLSDFSTTPQTNNLFKDDKEYKKNDIMQPKSYDTVLIMLRQLYQEKRAILIPGNIPSSKNSKEIIQQPTKISECCKRELYKVGEVWHCAECKQPAKRKFIPRLVMSKRCQQYIDNTRQYWINNRELFLSWIKDKPKPHFIGIYFIRESQHRWDFNNATALITDIMTFIKDPEQAWLPDDNVDEAIPVYLGSHYDKDKSGIIITLLDQNKYYQSLLNCL